MAGDGGGDGWGGGAEGAAASTAEDVQHDVRALGVAGEDDLLGGAVLDLGGELLLERGDTLGRTVRVVGQGGRVVDRGPAHGLLAGIDDLGHQGAGDALAGGLVGRPRGDHVHVGAAGARCRYRAGRGGGEGGAEDGRGDGEYAQGSGGSQGRLLVGGRCDSYVPGGVPYAYRRNNRPF